MKKKFRILVEGQNYTFISNNTREKFGFFTTRFVEADNSSEAEDIVLQLINDELKQIAWNDLNDPPVISIDEIEIISSFENIDVPGFGFTFYKEESQ